MTSLLRFASSLCALLVVLSVSVTSGYAQAAEQLSQVKKLYVDSLGTDAYAAGMHEELVRRLRKSHAVQVVSNPQQADALIKGTGRVWVTGYASLSPHTRGLSQPTFEGYL